MAARRLDTIKYALVTRLDVADVLETAALDDEAVEGGGALQLQVGVSDSGQRLDVVLTGEAKSLGIVLSRTRAKTLIEAGAVTIDGLTVRDANRKLKSGEALVLVIPPAEAAAPDGEPIALDVVFEDDHLIVIDKPSGLVVHPAPGHASGTLVNALIAHCGASLSGIGGVRRPGIVHRLDKDTSGLLVVAKTDAAHRGLSRLFADHGRSLPLTRTYLAFVWGQPERPFGVVDAPLGRHPTDRLRMAVVPEIRGRAAITHWRVQETFGVEASLVACNLETGRTHQIRVHMAHIGHPVLGDPLYAKGFQSKASRLAAAPRACLDRLGRQALHAAVLGFEHPVTGAYMEFVSELPADLAALKRALLGSI